MQLKEFNILLDIKKHNKNEYFEVVQGDSYSNVLNITLVDGLNNFNLSNTNVEIVFSKSDGTTVQQSDIAILNEVEGKIQCVLKTNTIASPGKVVAEVKVLQEETLLTPNTRFEFYVRKSLIDDGTVESSNEFGALQQVVLDYNDAIERVNQIEKQVPEQVVTDLNEVSTRVGPLSSLITRIKTSIVNALNGLQTDFNEHKAEKVHQYEVGSWTPRIAGSTTAGVHTYDLQNGRYIKMGNKVYITAIVRMTVKDAAMAGLVQIQGLPFANKNTFGAINIARTHNVIDMGAGVKNTVAYFGSANAFLNIAQNLSGGITQVVTADKTTNNTLFEISGEYEIN